MIQEMLRRYEMVKIVGIYHSDRSERQRMSTSYYLMPCVCQRLANDSDEMVRRNIALKPIAPDNVLRKLSKDVAIGVRLCLARNVTLPLDTIETLNNDFPSVVFNLASNVSVPPEMLDEILKKHGDLGDDEYRMLQLAVAKNKSVNKRTLVRLAKSMDYEVHKAAINNLTGIMCG